jgi:hypothetical protein
MLIDQILSDTALRESGLLSESLRGRMSRMHKFSLCPDFAVAADQLGLVLQDDPNKISPSICRLPFPECWVEVAHSDRLSARDMQPLVPLDRKVKKRRVGFLLTQTDNDGAFEAQLFLSLVGNDALIAVPLAVRFDPRAANVGEAGRFEQVRETRLSREQARSFWAGDTRYLCAVLALLHSRNASETSLVEFAKLNQRRERQGKSMLFSYHLVGIPSRYKRRNIADDHEPSGIELRAHFVRGHFKIRRTGVFFWNAFQRGNPALGFMHKDYELRMPKERVA